MYVKKPLILDPILSHSNLGPSVSIRMRVIEIWFSQIDTDKNNACFVHPELKGAK